MKKLFTSGLTGLALASLTALNANAADVKVVVLKSDNTPLNGVSIRYQYGSGGANTILASGANQHEATRTLTTSGASHKFTAAWKGTEYTIMLNRSVSDNDTTIYIYTTGVTFHAKSGSANVGNVSLRYTAGGSVSNQQGVTGVDGKYAIEMFPGTYTYNKSINSTSQSGTVTVVGDPLSQGNTQTEDITITKVNFLNAGTVKYPRQGSVDGTIGTDFYMIPGTYNLRFKTGSNPTYSRNVVISGANYNKVATVIRQKDHAGGPLAIGSVRGGRGSSLGWHVGAVNTNGGNHVSDQDPSVWIDVSDYSNAEVANGPVRIYEATKNGTISTQSQNAMINNIFDFQTNLMTLRLQKCNGEGLQNGEIRVGSSPDVNAVPPAFGINRHWYQMEVTSNQTDADGNTSSEVFTGAFLIEMRYSGTQQSKLVQFTGNDTIVWSTTNVKLNYAGNIAYGTGSITSHFIKPSMEMLPGILKVSFRNNGENIVDMVIPEQCTTFEKTAAIIRLVSSTNQPIAGATAEYQDGSWKSAGLTLSNGNAVALYDGLVTGNRHFRVTLDGKTQTKSNQHIANLNNVILFQTVNSTVNFTQSDASPQTGFIEYQAGNIWEPFGNNSGNITGSQNMELLPVNYNFRITYRNKTQTKTNQNPGNGAIGFNTVNALVNFTKSDASPQTGNIEVELNGWEPFGNNSGNITGSQNMELLPVNHNFRIAYRNKTQTKTNQNPGNASIDFNTVNATVVFKNSANGNQDAENIEVQLNGWEAFGAGSAGFSGSTSDELLPVNHNFRITYKTKTQTKTNHNPGNGYVTFNTAMVVLRGFDGYNSPLINTHFQYQGTNGWVTLSAANGGTYTDEFLPVNHNIRANYNNGSYISKSNFLPSLVNANEQVFNFVNVYQDNFDIHKDETIAPEAVIDIYPVPATSNLNVHVYGAEKVMVEIFAVDGKRVYEYSSDTGFMDLDVSDLNKGNYILRLSYDDKVETRKFIKQ